jgi:hypothetical protein
MASLSLAKVPGDYEKEIRTKSFRKVRYASRTSLGGDT